MFRIGDFSVMGKTTVKTLRYYDEIGLLKPEAVDKFTGYRLYTTAQLFTLHRIQSLRQAGLSIDEIALIQAGCNVQPILERRRSELSAALEETRARLARLEFMLQGEKTMSYTAIIKDLPACIVYSKRMTVPSYDAYFQVIPAIGAQVMGKYPDLKCATPEYCFIRYLDREYRERDISIEFCEAVTERKPDFEDIVFQDMPAVSAVSVMHKGPYSELRAAYAFAFRWLEENGYTPADAPRENYIDGIWNKDNEADWLTELQIPVLKK